VEKTRGTLAVVAVGLALCLMLYHQVRWLAPQHPFSSATFAARRHDLHFPVAETRVGRVDPERNWRPRILSNVLGSLALHGVPRHQDLDRERLGRAVGIYSGLWLAATTTLYMVFVPTSAPLAMLGTYAAVAYGYLPGIADRVYPWDMPALCFFALFVCLLIRRRPELFLWVLPLGVLCKETVAVLALAYLFVEGTWPRRPRLFGTALACALATRLLAGLSTQSLSGGAPSLALVRANLRFLVTGEFPHPEWYLWISGPAHALLLDAGLLLGFLLHPYRDGNTRMLRVLVLAFALAILACGIVFEYRIWFELVPLCLYPFLRQADAARAEA
jgi:hypothetical protein